MKTTVFVYSNGINSWMASNLATGIAAMGVSAEEAISRFKAIWADRGEVVFRLDHPPGLRPPGARRNVEEELKAARADLREARDRGEGVFAKLIKAVHPDVAGARTFSADEVAGMLIELRDAMRSE